MNTPTLQPHRWFCFDGEDYCTFESAEEARDKAESAIQRYRDDAPEGWAEEVNYVAWGKILEGVNEEVTHEHDETCRGDDGCCYSLDHDRIVDYYLAPFPPLDGEGAEAGEQRATERVVAWLRAEALRIGPMAREIIEAAADCIENGKHRREEKP